MRFLIPGDGSKEMVTLTMSITHPSKIRDLLENIADCDFDIDDISFDPEERVVSIRFFREDTDRARVVKKGWILKKVEIPKIECFLRIHHAKTLSMTDTAGIGIHTFEDIEYDSNVDLVKIITIAPAEIAITVEKFELSIELTDRVVAHKTITSPFY
jgi:hypothetical protein